jgi:hypothetical protein
MHQCFWIQFVIRSRTLGENCISTHGFPGSDGCVHTHIQWSMSGIVATVKSAFAASPRNLTSGPRFVAESRSRSRAPWIARKGFVNARNASPGSVSAWDHRALDGRALPVAHVRHRRSERISQPAFQLGRAQCG